jgi:hypothetical protein
MSPLTVTSPYEKGRVKQKDQRRIKKDLKSCFSPNTLYLGWV